MTKINNIYEKRIDKVQEPYLTEISQNFKCGPEDEIFYEYLWQDAPSENIKGIADTFLVFDRRQPKKIIAYYSLKPMSLLFRTGDFLGSASLIELSMFCVDFDYRGQGYGKDIFNYFVMNHIKETKKHIGAQAIILFSLNAASDCFYEKIGFTKIGKWCTDDKLLGMVVPDNGFNSGLTAFMRRL